MPIFFKMANGGCILLLCFENAPGRLLFITLTKDYKMSTGTVKFFNTDKGFGFITREGESELFFHISDVRGQEPREGDKVEFEVGEGRKGPCAQNVSVSGS
jgi:CspA family cold shock protein